MVSFKMKEGKRNLKWNATIAISLVISISLGNVVSMTWRKKTC